MEKGIETLEKVTVTSFDDYQRAAMRTCKESSMNMYYMVHGLMEEIGEVSGKFSKCKRDHNGILSDETKRNIAKEIGDVMWMVAGIAKVAGQKLSDIITVPLGMYNITHTVGDTEEEKNLWIIDLVYYAQGFARKAVLCDDEINADALVSTLSRYANTIGYTLGEVLQMNVDKLADRYNRGVINGSGDNR